MITIRRGGPDLEYHGQMEELWREQKLTGDQVEKSGAILSQVIETAAAKADIEKAKLAHKPAAA